MSDETNQPVKGQVRISTRTIGRGEFPFSLTRLVDERGESENETDQGISCHVESLNANTARKKSRSVEEGLRLSSRLVSGLAGAA